MAKAFYYDSDVLKLKESTSRYKFSLPFVDGKSVLDIGCGARMGPFIAAESAKKVVAFDISADAVSYSRNNWPKENIFYLAASALSLPFKSASFDCALSFEVIEHIDDYQAHLSEAKRVIKDGGTLIISTPNRAATSPQGPITNPEHVREFELEEFTAILKQYFSEITVWGQSSSQKVKDLRILRKESYQSVSRLPSWLKNILPAKLKDLSLRKYYYICARFSRGIREEAISEKDFPISSGSVAQAEDFIVICKNKFKND